MSELPPWSPVGLWELVTRPLVRDWPVFAAGVAFFFACEHGSKFIMNRMSQRFRALSEDEKNTWTGRFVACVNSVLCSRSAYNFFFVAQRRLADNDLYAVVPGQLLSTELIVAYFAWDLFVCLRYNWSMVYTVHAIVSLTGTYLLTWPYSERWHMYFGGVFESSNVFFHLSEMLATLGAAPNLVAILKAVFAIMFLLIRPIGGTYFSFRYSQALFANGLARAHHAAVPIVCFIVTWSLMALQWVWSWTVLRGVLAAAGLVRAEAIDDGKVRAPPPPTAATNDVKPKGE
jgi:hypothetical protein